MKVGILVTIVSGFGKKNYYQSQEAGLGKALIGRGHEVVVFKCVAKDQPKEDQRIGDSLTVRYIPVRALGVHGFLPAAALDPDLDALLCFADTQIFLPHLIRFCEQKGIPFVPYIGIAHSAQRNLKSKFMDALFAVGTLRAYRKKPVIAKSEPVREELTVLGVKDCTVAPVGLDESVLKLDYASYDRKKIRSELGYSDNETVVSFIGRMKPEKMPLEAVEMFGRIRDQKNFRFLMVGEGYLLDEIRDRIRVLGLEDRVRLIEKVPYEQMWKIHWASDYNVNLCTREIFGMALLEAVLYRTSSAALHAPGPDTILKDMKGHRLCSDLTEVEEWLCGEYPPEAELISSSGTLLERFSWNICADQFCRICDADRKQKQEPETAG